MVGATLVSPYSSSPTERHKCRAYKRPEMFGRKPTNADAPEPNRQAISVADELDSLWQPAPSRPKLSVEQLLLERGHISEEQLTQAKNVQQQTPGKSLAQVLLTMSAASEAQ